MAEFRPLMADLSQISPCAEYALAVAHSISGRLEKCNHLLETKWLDRNMTFGLAHADEIRN
jgi:hypothetical protein